jgi:uncharacterized membrane protein YagU involved in acid resistance
MLGTRRLLQGGLAGLAATAPMTLAMLAMHRRLPRHERHSLPPRKITIRAARRVGLREHLGAGWQRQTATLTAHFAYGAAAGSLYGPLAKAMHLPPVAGGVAFGLVVWLVSYLGLLPAVGLFPPATRESERQNVLMIVAHVAWGAALGVLVDAWGERDAVE